MRLSQAIEACDRDLNATATSSLTEDGLRRVLWCLTRQRPLVLMSGLQVTLYNELFARLLVRHQQLVRRTVNSQAELVDSLVGRQCKDLKNETELIDSLATFSENEHEPIDSEVPYFQTKPDGGFLQWGIPKPWLSILKGSNFGGSKL